MIGKKKKYGFILGGLVLALLLLAPCAEANTRFGFGTIVAVDAEAKRYTVLYEFYNLNKPSVWRTMSYTYGRKTYGGDLPVFYLDGQPATPEEALVVGRAICQTMNNAVMFVATGPGPHRPGAFGTIDRGLCHVTLGRKLPVPAVFHSKRGAGEPEPIGGSMELLLDLSGPAIRGAFVLDNRRLQSQTPTDYRLDCSGLTRDGDALRGTIAVRVPLPPVEKGESGFHLVSGEDAIAISLDLDLRIDADGAVAGRCTGTINDLAHQGEATGRVWAPTPRPERPRIWLWVAPFPHIRGTWLILTFDEEGVVEADGLLLYSKGDKRGSTTAGDLRLEGDRLQGSVTGTVPGKSEVPITCTIDTEVLGDRFLMGSCRVSTGDEAWTTTVRGGLCSAAGPRIEGPETKKAFAELKARFQDGVPKAVEDD